MLLVKRSYLMLCCITCALAVCILRTPDTRML